MYVVAIHGWKSDSGELSRNLGSVLGVTPYEARQRLVGGGPSVVACVDGMQRAADLAERIERIRIGAFILDATAFRETNGFLTVRRFSLEDPKEIRVEGSLGEELTIPHGEIEALIRASNISLQADVGKTPVRKFSIGRAALTGGLKTTRKVEKVEENLTETRDEVLGLFSRERKPFLFPKNELHFAGLGSSLQPTRSLNFSFLVEELRRRNPDAVYDDRLLRRADQARLLGSLLVPEDNLLLAMEILVRCLKKEMIENPSGV